MTKTGAEKEALDKQTEVLKNNSEAERKALEQQAKVLKTISDSACRMEKSSNKMFWASVIYFAASILIGLIALIF